MNSFVVENNLLNIPLQFTFADEEFNGKGLFLKPCTQEVFFGRFKKLKRTKTKSIDDKWSSDGLSISVTEGWFHLSQLYFAEADQQAMVLRGSENRSDKPLECSNAPEISSG